MPRPTCLFKEEFHAVIPLHSAVSVPIRRGCRVSQSFLWGAFAGGKHDTPCFFAVNYTKLCDNVYGVAITGC